MTQNELETLAALRELDAAVKHLRTAQPKPDLRPLFARLDGLAAQLEGKEHLALRHYLERKSYDKALRLLEGRAAEPAPETRG